MEKKKKKTKPFSFVIVVDEIFYAIVNNSFESNISAPSSSFKMDFFCKGQLVSNVHEDKSFCLAILKCFLPSKNRQKNGKQK